MNRLRDVQWSFGDMTSSDFEPLPDTHCPPCPMRMSELNALDIECYPIQGSPEPSAAFPSYPLQPEWVANVPYA